MSTSNQPRNRFKVVRKKTRPTLMSFWRLVDSCLEKHWELTHGFFLIRLFVCPNFGRKIPESVRQHGSWFGNYHHLLEPKNWFLKKKSKLKVVATTWMSRWKLGSKVRISELQHQYTRFISRWNNPVILTIDPNFQHDLPHLIWQKYPIIYRVLIHPNSGCLGFLNHQTVWKASTVWCKPFL